MPELPSGTVTFLFTDIEGSTTRWEHQPEAMRAALARHDALLLAAIVDHGGYVVKTMGDAFHAAFSRACDALAAALDAQRQLQAEPWGEIGPLRVRMSLHTGEAEERDGDYYGPALNRAARILSAGHGGQVLLSQTTYDLVRDASPDGATLVDLGKHRLKDLIRPERIFQVVATDLPSTFPPLQTLERRPHNLPIHPTALLGRGDEIARVRERLLRDDVRLLTLTGPGGIGKTRLSLQIAADAIDRFADGVFFVALAPISDPDLVASTIAQTLDVRLDARKPVIESLTEHLAGKQLLLQLDNFEQILPAASIVSELLSAAPRLKILVTSRAALQVRGEYEYPVPPLALPDHREVFTPATLSQYGAVALFIERAAAIKPDFAVTAENAPAIAETCHRLDGLPLAIELAAARIRLLTPQAILTRLERRLPLLTGGARDLPARQQTLRDAIAWSYDLLSPGEQTLYRRLSVFVGGCTLEAAEAVCDPDASFGLDILDGITSLAAQSIVRQVDGPDGEPRLTMLATVREYGLELLEASGEAGVIRSRHVAYFVSLAEEAVQKLFGPEQIAWLRRLDVDHDNLRAVLTWSQAGEIPVEIGLRLVGTLHAFWSKRGFLGESRGRVAALLAVPGAEAPTVGRARALWHAAWLAFHQADYAAGRSLAKESAQIHRRMNDLRGVGRALVVQALAEANLDNTSTARSLLEESVAIARKEGNRFELAIALGNLGGVVQSEGDYEAAAALRGEAASIAREIGDRESLGTALAGLASLARLRGSHEESAALWKEDLVVSSEIGHRWITLRALAGLAGAACLAGDHGRAARIFGAVEAVREAAGTRELPGWRAINDRDVADARAAIGDKAFSAAWADGQGMSLEQAVAYALDEATPG